MQCGNARAGHIHTKRGAHYIEGVEFDVDFVQPRYGHFVSDFNMWIVVYVVNFGSWWTLDLAPNFALLELVHVQVDLIVS